jgi:hypothetical protein
MCNWLIKFKGAGIGWPAQWINVFCETEEEAHQLAEAIEKATDLEYDYEVICLGTGQ